MVADQRRWHFCQFTLAAQVECTWKIQVMVDYGVFLWGIVFCKL